MIIDRFVVTEGLDGSGKSAIVPLIMHELQNYGKNVHTSAEPTEGYIGNMIHDILHNRSSIPISALPVLYVADRYHHIFNSKTGVINHAQKKDSWEICSRYIYSSLVYQSLTTEEAFVRKLNQDFPLPQFLFYIDVSPDTALKRIHTRGQQDHFEQIETLRKVHRAYQRVIAEAQQSKVIVHIVNGEQPVKSVAAEIINYLKKYL